jgi:hypothetical protein
MSKFKRSKPKIGMPDATLPKEEQERLALLSILELGERSIEEGKTVPVSVAMKRIRDRIRQYRKMRT